MMAVNTCRFYVYKIMYDDQVVYVGKGSKNRASTQQRAFNLPVIIDSEFNSESLAYKHEIKLIEELSPFMNVHKGGNGPRSKRKIIRKDKWTSTIERIGTRCYAARLALAFKHLGNISGSKLEQLRQVAYG